MKDPTIPNHEDRKKIMFYDTSDRQAKLRIRCQYDGMTQSQFFRMMVTGYIGNDTLIYEYIKKCKERFQLQGEIKRNKIDQIHKKTQINVKKFKLDDQEVENIFDIIETETGL